MSKTKVLVAFLILVSMPVVVFADFREHMDRFELGVAAGVGFYVGQESPVANSTLERVQAYNAVAFGDKNTLKWPGIETFGFEGGYRFDNGDFVMDYQNTLSEEQRGPNGGRIMWFPPYDIDFL